jgi:hypothetical protein
MQQRLRARALGRVSPKKRYGRARRVCKMCAAREGQCSMAGRCATATDAFVAVNR